MSEHAILKIKIQSTRGTKEFSFPADTTIANVIVKAVEAFGFVPGDKFELVIAVHAGEPLQPQRTLASYNITDGTALILTSIGGGV